MQPVTNHYQSNGACFQTCVGQYAFAVLRGSECWCSNFVPATTTSTDSCNQPCPGYPSDLCGSSSESLFAYIALRNSPLGTADGSSSPTSTIAPSRVTSVDSQVVSSNSFAATSSSSSLAPTSFSTSSPLTRTTLMQPVSSSFATSTRVLSVSSSPSTYIISTSSTSPPYPTTSMSSTLNLLTLSSQSSAASPSPVTVLETVTASPSVRISSVFIVCMGPLVFQSSLWN